MRGGFLNRQAIIIMIQVSAPPRPACYPTDKVWRDWLIQAHVSGLKVARRIDIGKSQGCRKTSHRLLPTDQIAYCHGCTAGYQRSMEQQGRCSPSAVMLTEEEEETV
jgi:hypothetical protein